MGSQSIPKRTPASNSACHAEKQFSGEVGAFRHEGGTKRKEEKCKLRHAGKFFNEFRFTDGSGGNGRAAHNDSTVRLSYQYQLDIPTIIQRKRNDIFNRLMAHSKAALPQIARQFRDTPYDHSLLDH